MTLRVFSYGGGRQSTAWLVLWAQGRVSADTALFCNVGDDSENPETLAYMAEVAFPYARAHGLNLIELRRVMRDGSVRTLKRQIEDQPRSIPIPVRLPPPAGSKGTLFARRKCTVAFKVEVVARWTRSHGATPDMPAVCGIGFSTDELHRATTVERVAWQATEYPLLDLRLSKRDCLAIVADAGLPPAPKSACWFCPFHTVEDWRRQAQDQPVVFRQSVEMEAMLADRRRGLTGEAGWFSDAMRPLPAVLEQGDLFAETEATCDAGSCFT